MTRQDVTATSGGLINEQGGFMWQKLPKATLETGISNGKYVN